MNVEAWIIVVAMLRTICLRAAATHSVMFPIRRTRQPTEGDPFRSMIGYRHFGSLLQYLLVDKNRVLFCQPF